MSYRRKPVLVEAFQYFPNIWTEIAVRPDWLDKARKAGTVLVMDKNTGRTEVHNGPYWYEPRETDWIVQDELGGLEVYTAQEFEKLYEPGP